MSCFWCEGVADYHPRCDGPGCSNLTHGEGSNVAAYCDSCKDAGGVDE